ncbi:MAG TPA: hypothetical protein PLK00_13190, partial [Candidatus Hydrogenedentes bacterium]|nr:hypothetical protein [Candidatus Hydrogenedentota bacterium]
HLMERSINCVDVATGRRAAEQDRADEIWALGLQLPDSRGGDAVGDLLRADGDPACVLLEEGVWCVNKRNELTWTVDLQPGQETALAYEYVVLVYF